MTDPCFPCVSSEVVDVVSHEVVDVVSSEIVDVSVVETAEWEFCSMVLYGLVLLGKVLVGDRETISDAMKLNGGVLRLICGVACRGGGCFSVVEAVDESGSYIVDLLVYGTISGGGIGTRWTELLVHSELLEV